METEKKECFAYLLGLKILERVSAGDKIMFLNEMKKVKKVTNQWIVFTDKTFIHRTRLRLHASITKEFKLNSIIRVGRFRGSDIKTLITWSESSRNYIKELATFLKFDCEVYRELALTADSDVKYWLRK